MPVKIMINVIEDKIISRTECEKATPQEMSLALTHIKIREEALLELFQKSSITWKDSKEK